MSEKQQEQNEKVLAAFNHLYAEVLPEKEYYVFMMVWKGHDAEKYTKPHGRNRKENSSARRNSTHFLSESKEEYV